MTTYYNTHMTAVPTRLLLDTNLSAEAKLTGALLYTFEDGGLSAQELADVLGQHRTNDLFRTKRNSDHKK